MREKVIDVIDGVTFVDVTKPGRAMQFIGGVRPPTFRTTDPRDEELFEDCTAEREGEVIQFHPWPGPTDPPKAKRRRRAR